MLEPLFTTIPAVTFLGVEKKQSALKIYRQLRTIDCDAVADFHAINRVRLAIFLLQLDAICHFRPLKVRHIHKGRLSRWLFLHHLSRHPRRSQSQRYRDLLLRLGLSPCAGHPTRLEKNCAGRFDRPENYTVGIAPFAQHQGKIWPIEYTTTLVKMLDDLGVKTFLFGSRSEAPALESIAKECKNAASVAGHLSFAEELDTIRNLSLMVTMDSSNMHFASAVGTPVVSIWGATHPDFGFYGYGQNRDNALCANLKCQPCSAYGKKPCRYGDYRCMLRITPETVLKKIQTILTSEK